MPEKELWTLHVYLQDRSKFLLVL